MARQQRWIEFGRPNLAGKLDGICGSDGVLWLDGRVTRPDTIHQKATARVATMAKVQTGITHYRIIRGELSRPAMVTGWKSL